MRGAAWETACGGLWAGGGVADVVSSAAGALDTGMEDAAASVRAGGGAGLCGTSGGGAAIGAAALWRLWVNPRERSAAALAGGLDGSADGVGVAGRLVEGIDGVAGVESLLMGLMTGGVVDVIGVGPRATLGTPTGTFGVVRGSWEPRPFTCGSRTPRVEYGLGGWWTTSGRFPLGSRAPALVTASAAGPM